MIYAHLCLAKKTESLLCKKSVFTLFNIIAILHNLLSRVISLIIFSSYLIGPSSCPIRFFAFKEEIAVILHYTYQEEEFSITVKWTDASGKSVVHQEAIARLLQKHGETFQPFLEVACLLDEKVDKFYEEIYTYLEEYKSIAYNPAHRRLLLQAYGEIVDSLDEGVFASTGEAASTVAQLCQQVLEKLRELLEVYLEDHAYRSKFRSRRRNYEDDVEEMEDIPSPQDFESLLLQ